MTDVTIEIEPHLTRLTRYARSLVRNPVRAALLIVAIGIGITTVFCTVAMIMGLTKSFTNQIALLGFTLRQPWLTFVLPWFPT